jgi:hypothetical protein
MRVLESADDVALEARPGREAHPRLVNDRRTSDLLDVLVGGVATRR